MKIAGLFFEVDVTRDMKSRSKRATLSHIAYNVAAIHPEVNPEALLNQLLFRETLGTTAMNNGIAMPHTVTADLHYPFMSVTQLARPILFGSPFDAKVDLIVTMLSPPHYVREFRLALSRLKTHLIKENAQGTVRHAQLATDLHELSQHVAR